MPDTTELMVGRVRHSLTYFCDKLSSTTSSYAFAFGLAPIELPEPKAEGKTGAIVGLADVASYDSDTIRQQKTEPRRTRTR